jgi:hypothetical protein
VLGRHRAGHAAASGGGRVEQRERPGPQLGRATLEAALDLGGDVVGRHQRRQRQSHIRSAAGERDLGDGERGRLETRPRRRASAVVREREPADSHQAGAAGPVRRVGGGGSRGLPPAQTDLGKAPGARRLDLERATQSRQRGGIALRLLQAEQRLARPP